MADPEIKNITRKKQTFFSHDDHEIIIFDLKGSYNIFHTTFHPSGKIYSAIKIKITKIIDKERSERLIEITDKEERDIDNLPYGNFRYHNDERFPVGTPYITDFDMVVTGEAISFAILWTVAPGAYTIQVEYLRDNK